MTRLASLRTGLDLPIGSHHAARFELFKFVVAPDRDAAETLTLGADRSRPRPRAHHTGRTVDITSDRGQNLPHLGDLVDGRLEDLPLRVVAEPLDPLPVVIEEGATLVEADTLRVRDQIERRLWRYAAVEQRGARCSEGADGGVILGQGRGVLLDSPGHDHIRLHAVPGEQDRTRARGAAVALVLRILRHADPLCPGERDMG